jgi:mannose-1-phosphate guanylyltransferase
METSVPWAIVLAAGDGTRLRDLTTDPSGRTIPKQFCSLDGDVSLLQLALSRAVRVAPGNRVTTVVAAQHEAWWSRPLEQLPGKNVIVQPRNRGTAIGTLLPLLSILDRDPDPRVVLLPADHFVADEAVLGRAMGQALAGIELDPERVVLLGIVPDEADGEFGWIVPAADGRPEIQRVLHFVEKPRRSVAMQLMSEGAVWNSFILAVRGRTLLELFRKQIPDVVRALEGAMSRRPEDLDGAYATLESVDFSRDVLEEHVDRLSVLSVPHCGWCDLGTPDRVGRCVRWMATATPPPMDTPSVPLVLRQSHAAMTRLSVAAETIRT